MGSAEWVSFRSPHSELRIPESYVMASAPLPPIHRRPDYSFAWVLLGVLVLAGVLVFSGIYVFSRYLTRQLNVDIRQINKRLEVDTPVGSLKAEKGELSETELRLPVYPGSRRTKRNGGTISIEIPSETNVRIVAAEYETDDTLEQVASFYRKRLGRAFKERRSGGRVEFSMNDAERQRRVIIRRIRHKTQIALANVTEATSN